MATVLELVSKLLAKLCDAQLLPFNPMAMLVGVDQPQPPSRSFGHDC
jgi:hypothetical protein